MAFATSSNSPTLRALDAVSVVLFGLLALFTGFVAPSASLEAVRLVVDTVFFLLCSGSLLLRRPVTRAYGHEHVPDEFWNTPAFARANDLMTAAWAAGFAVMAVADAAVIFESGFSLTLDLAIGLGVLGLVIAFTVRYPIRVATKHAS